MRRGGTIHGGEGEVLDERSRVRAWVRACLRACECALLAATVLERCIRSRGRVHVGAALSSERRILLRKLRTFCSEVWLSHFVERSGIPAVCTPRLVRHVHTVCLTEVACCMLHSISFWCAAGPCCPHDTAGVNGRTSRGSALSATGHKCERV